MQKPQTQFHTPPNKDELANQETQIETKHTNQKHSILESVEPNSIF